MVELLTTYDLKDILLFIVLLAAAFRALSSFLDWWRDKRKKTTLDEMKPDELEQKIKTEIDNRQKEIHELEIKREKDSEELRTQIKGVSDQVAVITGKIDLLIESDKDDIKAYITREYHYFCESQGWIDDYSMDSIERRYSHYLEEKGNSFVAQLMEALRALPRQRPEN